MINSTCLYKNIIYLCMTEYIASGKELMQILCRFVLHNHSLLNKNFSIQSKKLEFNFFKIIPNVQ